jgi:hypothetical protein
LLAARDDLIGERDTLQIQVEKLREHLARAQRPWWQRLWSYGQMFFNALVGFLLWLTLAALPAAISRGRPCTRIFTRQTNARYRCIFVERLQSPDHTPQK